MKRTVHINILFIVGVIICFILIIIKLSYVNVASLVDGIDIKEFANNRNTTKKTLYATRGSIYDINGDYLAQTVNCYTLIAYLSSSRTTDEDDPKHVVDKEMTAQKLFEVLSSNGIDITYDYILSRLKSEGLYQVEFGSATKELSESVKSQIEELNLPGIDFSASSKRYYQMGNFASYIVGYAKKDDDGKITGELGVESYFNDELTGSDGYTEYQTDSYGYKLPNSNENTKESTAGKNIYLTIDNNIQLFVEQEINDLVSKGSMEWLTWTIADANTGAIVASSSYPNYDPNKLDITSYLNPLVSYSYEPGSTMKIYSFMAAMEAGIYDGSKKYQSGTIKVNDATIKDFNTVGWGTITFDEGFAYSSNVAATNLAMELGIDGLVDFYTKAGFGEKTGITLPGEVSGDIDVSYRTELATASFGQGITTTPIQNIQGLTIVANNGVMLKPYIIDKIVDPNTGEVVYQGGREEVRKVTSAETASKMLDLMYDVVYSNKTDAKFYKPSSITIAGKTGTAQIPDPKTGTYLTGTYDYVRSFASVFPYDNPQYVLYISVKQYTGGIKNVATAVANVIDEIAKYKNLVDVVETDTNYIFTLDSYLNTDTLETSTKLKYLNLNPIILGDGKYVTNQYPNKGSKVLIGSKVFIKSSGTVYTMPDISGWSRNEVVTLCNLIGLNYNISGTGKVSSYSIEKDSVIDLTSTLDVTLS